MAVRKQEVLQKLPDDDLDWLRWRIQKIEQKVIDEQRRRELGQPLP